MDVMEKDIRNDIKRVFLESEKVGILSYKDVDMDEYVLYKWGNVKKLEKIHEERFTRLMNAGFEQEAESLTLMELPKNEDLFYEIITCISLKGTLKRWGIHFRGV